MNISVHLVGKENVDLAKIVYLKAEANYSEVFLECGKTILISKTLKVLEAKFIAYNFFRPHKSFLINLGHVKNYRPNYSNKISLSNNHEVELSRRKKIDFLNLFPKNKTK
jgi:DNA-binding LytR/AlgR family response regulator